MNNKTSWQNIEKYLKEKTASGNMMALLEAEKLFKQTMADFDLPGDDIERQIKALNFVFTGISELEKTRSLSRKIISKANFSISSVETIRNLEIYYQAIEDLESFKKKKLTGLKKLRLYSKTFLPAPKILFRKFILIFFIFFLLIFLLDSTSFGRMLVDFFVTLSHVIFSWVLFVVLLIAGIAILVIGTIYYVQRKRS